MFNTFLPIQQLSLSNSQIQVLILTFDTGRQHEKTHITWVTNFVPCVEIKALLDRLLIWHKGTWYIDMRIQKLYDCFSFTVGRHILVLPLSKHEPYFCEP